MSEGKDPLDEQIKKALKKFDGIHGTLNGLLQPPRELTPEKRGLFVCMAMGTIGIAALGYMKAPWYAFVAEVFLVICIAILVRHKRKKNG